MIASDPPNAHFFVSDSLVGPSFRHFKYLGIGASKKCFFICQVVAHLISQLLFPFDPFLVSAFHYPDVCLMSSMHLPLNASLWKKNDHGLEMFALRRMRGDGDSVEYVCPCPSLGRPFWAVFPSSTARSSSEISGGWPKRWHFQSPETLVGGPKNTRTPRASQKYDRNRSKRCSFHRVQCWKELIN